MSKIAILQLSDIHITSARDSLLGRAREIAASVRGIGPQLDGCLIAFTGDLTYSGTAAQFELVKQFTHELTTELQNLESRPSVANVSIPGNHDCDFSQESKEVRDLVVGSTRPQAGILDPGNPLLSHCLKVQTQFFAFEGSTSGIPGSSSPQMHYVRELSLGATSIKCYCLNTAWDSQIHEQQGQMLYPIQFLTTTATPADLTLTLLHHPFNWFEATNARELRNLIEASSDLILTGHEHEPAAYAKQHLDSRSEARYVEGAVLQDPKSNSSSFNLIILDLDEKKYSVGVFSWDGSRYLPVGDPVWHPFMSNRGLARVGFRLTADFESYLSDAGAGFSHPRVPDIRLDDIFIYPDVQVQPIDKRLKGQFDAQAVTVHSRHAEEYLATHDLLSIYGPDLSGKTALSKMVYKDLIRRGEVVPLLLDGRTLTSVNHDSLNGLLREAVRTQYGEEAWQPYLQLPRANKALIVDDFHLSKYNLKGQLAFVGFARERFRKLLLFSDDIFQVESLATTSAERNEFKNFNHLVIRPFGHLLRGKLITTWVGLGREFTTPSQEIAHEISITEQLVSTLLGKNLLPSFPLTVLTLLQASEVGKSLNTTSGSYGYIFEELITQALNATSTKSALIDTKYTYLAYVAFQLFELRRDTLTQSEFEAATDRYFKEHNVRFDIKQMLSELVAARILSRRASSVYFKYQYIYFYFVARYFKDNIGDPQCGRALRDQLYGMADHIYAEQNANILIFFLYLSRDRDLIGYLINNATKIYEEFAPTDLDKDIDFVNKMHTAATSLVLPDTDPGENVENYREDLDRREESTDLVTVTTDAEHIKYTKDLHDVFKINIAFKTMQVMGQVLRNFSGSLKTDVKHSLTRECYFLGLRTLRAILGVAETNLPELRQYVSNLLKEKQPVSSVSDLAVHADRFVIWLTVMITYGVVKNVSHSVGLEQLSLTYADLLHEEGSNKAVALIDLSIKLDHFGVMPEVEIETLAAELKKNAFAYTILRDLVANHMYLFPVDYKIRQKLATLLDFKMTDTRVIDNPAKIRGLLQPEPESED